MQNCRGSGDIGLVVASMHHRNTARIADVMAGVLDAVVRAPEDVPSASLRDYSLVGFGSGVYYGRMHKTLLDRVRGMPDAPPRRLSITAVSLYNYGPPARCSLSNFLPRHALRHVHSHRAFEGADPGGPAVDARDRQHQDRG